MKSEILQLGEDVIDDTDDDLTTELHFIDKV